MGDGRKVKADCGCPGEVVIGTYVECLAKCHKRACNQCGGTAFSPFVSPLCPPGSVSCDKCGRIKWSWSGK